MPLTLTKCCEFPTRIINSRITNNTILKSCAKEGLVVTTLWLMRGKFVGLASSIMCYEMLLCERMTPGFIT